MKKNTILTIAGAALCIISCWLPWVKASGDMSENGFPGGKAGHFGIFIIVIAVISVIFSALNKKWLDVMALILGLVMPVIVFMNINKNYNFDFMKADTSNLDRINVSLGFGFWGILIGGLIIVAANWMAIRSINNPSS